MKRVIAVLVFLLGATWVVNSHAQFEKGLECFDQSDSQVQLEKCAHKFISPNEEKVDRLFSKLKEKYKSNDEMRELLTMTKNSWDRYRNEQCIFEALVAIGGDSTQRRSMKSSHAFLRCVYRTLEERIAALEGF